MFRIWAQVERKFRHPHVGWHKGKSGHKLQETCITGETEEFFNRQRRAQFLPNLKVWVSLRIDHEYVEYMDELSNTQPDEVREADYCIRQLMYILRNPLYQRATATSMEALGSYLTPQTLEYFKRRGGLQQAHASERLPWPGPVKLKK